VRRLERRGALHDRGVVAGAAHRRRLGFDRQALAAQHLEHALRLPDDLGSDAVTRQDCDLHVRWSSKKRGALCSWRRAVFRVDA